jgi:hypothetical protein
MFKNYESYKDYQARACAIELTLGGHGGVMQREIVQVLEEEFGAACLRNTVQRMHHEGLIAYAESGSEQTPNNPPRISAIRYSDDYSESRA